jgi:cation diffusion facilitator family transporter
MAKVSGSTRVVLAALGGNMAVAAVKFAAFALSGSSAMLSEGFHSLVDTGDQLLLLVGQRRAAKPPDASHPFGYGMEMYFWSFIVALLIFFVGGALAVWQGVQKIVHPGALERPWLSLGVLAACAVFEGVSFRTAYREYRRIVAGVGGEADLLRFVRVSKDPSVFATLLEDGAALTGLAVAAAGVAGSSLLGLAWADGAASVAIGALLLAVAALLTNETRSLIAGEAASAPVQARIRAELEASLPAGLLNELSTLQLGPRAIFVFACVNFEQLPTGAAVRALTDEVERRVRAIDPRIRAVGFYGPGGSGSFSA